MKYKLNKRRNKMLVGTSVLMIALVFLIFLGIYLFPKKVIYSIESRNTEVKQAQETLEHGVEGWIRVQGTNIDYPIVLDDGLVDLSSIMDDFAWVNQKIEESSNRLVIFGHNILNVSKTPLITDENHVRFEQLMSFVYYDFVKENKYIEITQNGQTSLYAIYGVSFEIENYDLYYIDRYSQTDMKKYIKQTKENSYFDFKLDVSDSDNLISLVTCTRMFGNEEDMVFKVDARKLRDGERAINYSVGEKSNYEEVKRIMKEGDEGDEKA